jgi:hypothetical protein
MLSVRLPAQIEQKLSDFCKQKSLSKSQVVKEALTLYIQQRATLSSPYELGADLFGTEGSGRPDASATYKKRVKRIVSEKYSG